MTAASILTECRARQIRLAIEGGALTFEGPPGAMDAALLGQIREHKAELLEQLQAANDTTSCRWRITQGDGRVFEVDTWPLATLAEVLANEPEGTTAEPVPEAVGGHLPPGDVEIIKAVCAAWEATPDEIRDAIQETAANPALMDGWRREARGLGLDITPCQKPGISQAGRALEVDIGADTGDRITCRDCRLLRPGNLCGSPAWGPRYHPPPLPHRCSEFLPKAGDPDQRTGRERWPQLREGRP